MKIIYLISSIHNSAGIERVLSIKMNYLVRQMGYEIILVTTDQKGRKPFFEFDSRIRQYDLDLNYSDIIEYPILYRKYLFLKKSREYRKRLQEIIWSENPDLLVSVASAEMFFMNKIKHACPVIMEFHFGRNVYRIETLERYKSLMGRILAWWRTRRLIKCSQFFDSVVVLTEEDKRIWEQTNSKIYQIYNPLPFESKEVSSLDSKNIITVGRLTAQKNYDSLIKAWRIVQSRHPDWTMNVWGDGELKEHLQSLIKQCGVQDTFLLRGVTKNIREEYLKSSAYVMSSIYEGFPMVLLEASSFGLPLISYSCECGPRDIIEDGKNGVLIPVNDEEKLAEAMCRIIEDEELRKEMGRQAKIMSERFSPDRILPQWPKYFEKLMRKYHTF